MESMDPGLQRKIRRAKKEPLILTDRGSPVLVARDLLDDDLADDSIAEKPEFRRTIQLARKEKALGHVNTLTEIRRKYKQGHLETPGPAGGR